MTLKVFQENCTGCKACMLACSFYHDHASSYTRSRLYIEKDESVGYANPLFCAVCKDHECVEVCPVDAIVLDANGYAKIDKDLCTGCEDCVDECRSKVMKFDADRNIAYTCDYCDGEPICARVCVPKAIVME